MTVCFPGFILKKVLVQTMMLAADIGGTKTTLMIFSSEAELGAPRVEETLPSGHYPSLEALVGEFLGKVNVKVERASFAVAGPVIGRQAKITNLPWVMDEVHLAEALNLSAVYLLNDLLAIAHVVPSLGPADLYTLNKGELVHDGAIAVVAPGTGLGEAYLTWDGTRYQAYASEGGHGDFAPGNPREAELLRYLWTRYEHVSYERVCSGKGLPNIYAYLKEVGYAEEPAWLAEQLAAAGDPTPVIINTALNEDGPSELCTATLTTFISILGAEAGNMALKVLATGGVYLGGGIPPRILSALKRGGFMEAFKRKGRFSDLMSRIPVYVILNPRAALLGAACHVLYECD
jgi:glucokinase